MTTTTDQLIPEQPSPSTEDEKSKKISELQEKLDEKKKKIQFLELNRKMDLSREDNRSKHKCLIILIALTSIFVSYFIVHHFGPNTLSQSYNSLEIKYNMTIEAFKNLEMEHEILKSRYRIATKETQSTATATSTFTVLDAIAYLLAIDLKNPLLYEILGSRVALTMIISLCITILLTKYKMKKDIEKYTCKFFSFFIE